MALQPRRRPTYRLLAFSEASLQLGNPIGVESRMRARVFRWFYLAAIALMMIGWVWVLVEGLVWAIVQLIDVPAWAAAPNPAPPGASSRVAQSVRSPCAETWQVVVAWPLTPALDAPLG